jgi:hypothetical protein
VERKRPSDVAAYTLFGLVGSASIAKPSAPFGMPVAFCHVAPTSML